MPAFAASGDVDLGNFALTGTCGIPGARGPGNLLTASLDQPMPIGTQILTIASGVANSGFWTAYAGADSDIPDPTIATIQPLSGVSRLITLLRELPVGETFAFRSTLSTSVIFTMTHTVLGLPDGYVAGAEAKTSGATSSSLMLCSAF